MIICQDLHSPSNSRRTRRQQSESDSMMTDSPLTRVSCGKARVNVSQVMIIIMMMMMLMIWMMMMIMQC